PPRGEAARTEGERACGSRASEVPGTVPLRGFLAAVAAAAAGTAALAAAATARAAAASAQRQRDGQVGHSPSSGIGARPACDRHRGLPKERRHGRISRTVTCPLLACPIRGTRLTLQLPAVINGRAAAIPPVTWQFSEPAARKEGHRTR